VSSAHKKAPAPAANKHHKPATSTKASEEDGDGENFDDGFFTGNTRDEEERLYRERDRLRLSREAELKTLEEQKAKEELALTKQREDQKRRDAEEEAARAQRLKDEQIRLDRAKEEWELDQQKAKEEGTTVAAKKKSEELGASSIFEQPKAFAEKAKPKKKEDDDIDALFGSVKHSRNLFDNDDDDDFGSPLKLPTKASVKKASLDADFDELFGVTKKK